MKERLVICNEEDTDGRARVTVKMTTTTGEVDSRSREQCRGVSPRNTAEPGIVLYRAASTTPRSDHWRSCTEPGEPTTHHIIQ